MSRDWCFTVFDKEELGGFEEGVVKYAIWGKEVCPTTKRKHLQCYANFYKPMRIKASQKALGCAGAHFEMKRGSRDEAREYCMKDGDWKEWGKYDPLTKEDYFTQPIGWLKANKPEFYCRYYKGLDRLQSKGEKWRELSVTVLWGEPGTGKTRKVMAMDDVYKLDRPYAWWDGYEGESILLLDDYEPLDIPRGMLLNILDGYQLRLPTKGSFTYAKWTKVYITCNENPDDWIDREKGLRRRIHRTECVTA